MHKDERQPPKRKYPPFYEKVVPIAIGVVVIIVTILLILTVSIALGIFAGAG